MIILGVNEKVTDGFQRFSSRRGVRSLVVEPRNDIPLLFDVLGSDFSVDGELSTPKASASMSTPTILDRTHSKSVRSLPPNTSNPTSTNLINTLSRLALFTSQISNNRRYEIRREGNHHLLWPNGSSHGSSGVGSDRIGENIVFGSFDGEGLGESENG